MATPITPPLAGGMTGGAAAAISPPVLSPAINTAEPMRPPLDARRSRMVEIGLSSDGAFSLDLQVYTLGNQRSVWELRNATGDVVSTHLVGQDEVRIGVASGWEGGSLVLTSDPDAVELLRLVSQGGEGELASLTVRGLQNLESLELSQLSATTVEVSSCPTLRVLYADGCDLAGRLILEAVPQLHAVNLANNFMPSEQVSSILFLLAATAAGKTGDRQADLYGNALPTAPGEAWAAQLEAAGWVVEIGEEEEEETGED
jgi:hypothetical protein